MNNTIDLNNIEIKKVIRIMMANSDVDSLAALARELGIAETTFRSAVTNGSLKLNHLTKAAEIMGYKIVAQKME
jgi:energy-converting hydrogenase A subunit M